MSSNYHRNRHDDPLNPARGFINALIITVVGMLVGYMMWAALSAANSAEQVRSLVHQEAFVGYRTAGVGR